MVRPVTTINIPPAPIAANVEAQSAASTLPNEIGALRAQLVDPSNQWPTTVDNTRHLKCWGIQINRGALGWRWWLFSGCTSDSPVLEDGATGPAPLDTVKYLAFGTRNRNGSMPSIDITYSSVGESAGQQIRLAILSSVAVSLGAGITALGADAV